MTVLAQPMSHSQQDGGHWTHLVLKHIANFTHTSILFNYSWIRTLESSEVVLDMLWRHSSCRNQAECIVNVGSREDSRGTEEPDE